jgi:hypothetical protein
MPMGFNIFEDEFEYEYKFENDVVAATPGCVPVDFTMPSNRSDLWPLERRER